MSLFSSSRQQPETDTSSTEEDLPPDDAAADQDSDTGDGAPASREEPEADDGDAAEDGGQPPRGRLAKFRAEFGDRYPTVNRALPWVITGLAVLFVQVALLLPTSFDRITLASFIRMPVEPIYLAALLLVLPRKASRVLALAVGVGLGVLTILRCIDIGFYSVLDRPFDPVLDWILFDDAEEFFRSTVGQAGAMAAVVGIVILVLLVLVLMTLAVRRLSNIVTRNSATATRATLVLGASWITISGMGLQAVDGVPFAAQATSRLVQERARLLKTGLNDEQEFAKQAAVDDFRDTPPDKLLTGTSRQGRHLRVRRELRPRRRRGPADGASGRRAAQEADRPAEQGRDSRPRAAGSPHPRRARAVGSPTPPSCRGCGSTTTSATARPPPATASPSPAPSSAPRPGGRSE